jgi:hypothetical protein
MKISKQLPECQRKKLYGRYVKYDLQMVHSFEKYLWIRKTLEELFKI